MVRKNVAAMGVAGLLIGVGVALAAPASAQSWDLQEAVGVSFGAELPLSPMSQQNAVRAAEDYLEVSAFSRQGLIEQLEYSEFSTADATFAVDSITVDWNLQAAKAAQDYLEVSAFSRSALIDQLMYSGFTASEAAYGVSTTGL
jgi:hypothetical protein